MKHLAIMLAGRAAFLVSLAIPGVAQTTWHVDAGATGPGDGTAADPFSRIDFALGQPQVITGDTLLVEPGQYEEEAIFLSTKEVVIEAVAGPEQTFLTGSESGGPSLLPFVSIFGVNGTGTVLRGFTFAGFAGVPGSNTPALEIIGTEPLIENCRFEGQQSSPVSTLIQVTGGAPSFVDCSWGATSVDPGGLQASSADLSFTNCVWMSTTAPIWLSGGSLNIDGCEFDGNSGKPNSSLSSTVCASQAKVTITDSSFRGIETATGFFVGPQHVFLEDCQTIVQGSSILGGLNLTGSGAGIHAEGGTLTALASTFERLIADRGGAVALESCLAGFEACEFINNNGGLEDFDGGAIRADLGGNLALIDCDFVSNSAGAGGAVACGSTPLQVTGSRFVDNRAFRGTFFDGFMVRGGAILASDSALIEGCEFDGNLARSDYQIRVMDNALGGAIYLGSDATVRGSLFRDNACDAGVVSSGGAVWAGVNCTVERSVFVENRAEQSALAAGGALGGVGTAVHCTLVENNTSGLAASAESWLIRNSILVPALGTVESIGVGSTVEYCLSPSGIVGTGNVTAEPGFRGPEDYELLPGSAAIDAGDPLSPVDRDGSRADMGVFPFELFDCGPGCVLPSGPQSCPAAANSSGLPGRVLLMKAMTADPGEYILIADQLPKSVIGCFLVSRRRAYLPHFEGGAGTLCLGSPIVRLAPSHANLAGQTHRMIDLASLPHQAGPVAGEEWSVQFWHRDRLWGQATSHLTASLTVVLDRD